MDAGRLFHIEAAGHAIAVRAFNEDLPGTPIVVIHGVLASVNFWHAGMLDAVACRRWYSVGLPAHYPSRAPTGFAHADAGLFETLMAAVLDTISPDRPAVLLGHSTGGFVALNLAAGQPQRVRAVISVGGFAQGPFNGLEGLVQKAAVLGGRLGRWLFSLQLHLTAINRTLCKWLSLTLVARWRDYWRWPHLDAQFRNFHPDMRHWDHRALFHLFRGIHRLDIRDRLSLIKCPVLVVAGTRDPIIPISQPQLLLAHIPHAKSAWLDGVGHMPFAEAALAYTTQLTVFIEQVVEGPPC